MHVRKDLRVQGQAVPAAVAKAAASSKAAQAAADLVEGLRLPARVRLARQHAEGTALPFQSLSLTRLLSRMSALWLVALLQSQRLLLDRAQVLGLCSVDVPASDCNL